MASLEYLRECMERDLEIMEDKTKPDDIRAAARARFWHCEKRAGTMERNGATEDSPGVFLIGYSEEQFFRKPRKTELAAIDLKAKKAETDRKAYGELVMQKWDDVEHADKRKMLDHKAEIQIAAREKL